MRKLFYLTVFAAAIILSSCGVKTYPIKGTYQERPFEVVVDQSYDQVWDNIIDLFAQTGTSIKLIDRQSGLITSQLVSPREYITNESKQGTLENPNAHIVVEKRVYLNSVLLPTYITADWNIRIKKAGNNKTLVNVNLVNLQPELAATNGKVSKFYIKAISTGNFEKSIAGKITK